MRSRHTVYGSRLQTQTLICDALPQTLDWDVSKASNTKFLFCDMFKAPKSWFVMRSKPQSPQISFCDAFKAPSSLFEPPLTWGDSAGALTGRTRDAVSAGELHVRELGNVLAPDESVQRLVVRVSVARLAPGSGRGGDAAASAGPERPHGGLQRSGARDATTGSQVDGKEPCGRRKWTKTVLRTSVNFCSQLQDQKSLKKSVSGWRGLQAKTFCESLLTDI